MQNICEDIDEHCEEIVAPRVPALRPKKTVLDGPIKRNALLLHPQKMQKKQSAMVMPRQQFRPRYDEVGGLGKSQEVKLRPQ